MKEFIVGNGIRITESEDMGIFIHFKSKSGNDSGYFLGNTNDTPGHRWACEILEDVAEKPDIVLKKSDQIKNRPHRYLRQFSDY